MDIKFSTKQTPLVVAGGANVNAVYGPWDSLDVANEVLAAIYTTKNIFTGVESLDIPAGTTVGIYKDSNNKLVSEYWYINNALVLKSNTDDYYTKTEVDNALNNLDISNLLNKKQDLISDLDVIRNGASLGATALLEESHLGDYSKPEGGIPKSDLSSEVQTSLDKADTALQTHQSLADYVKTDDSRLSDARTPVSHKHTKSDITDFPTSMPASDVYTWAKSETKPIYTASEVGALPNTTTIPSKTSQLTNDSNFISSLDGYATEKWVEDKNYLTEHQDLSGYEKTSNIVTSISNTSTDIQYPSAKAVYTALSDKQDILTFDNTPISGSSNPVNSDGIYTALQSAGKVKTVNNVSPDTKGNIAITIPTVNNNKLTVQKNGTTVATFTANQDSDATANITVPTKISELTNDSGFLTEHQNLSEYAKISDIPISDINANTEARHSHTNKDVLDSISNDNIINWTNKQDTLVSGINIKTVNNISLLGEGNINIQGGEGTVKGVQSSDGTNLVDESTGIATIPDFISKSSTVGLLKNDGTIDTTEYSTFNGDYDDLTNKPTIPTNISELTNDSNFIKTSSTSGLIKNDGSIDTTSYSTFDGNYTNLTNKPNIPSKISELTNDTNFISDSNYIHTDNNYTNADKEQLSNITSLVPEQASSSNQLADKDFVNSSITTATAIYKGNFTNLDTLKATTADNNDYAFYVYTDTDGKSVVDRYKHDGTQWIFEYNVNNSGMTAAQLAATLSGITADMVASMASKADIPNATSLLTNDSNFISTSTVSGLIKNDGTIDTTEYVTKSDMTKTIGDVQDILATLNGDE